jgi:hypothetical protein
MLRYCSGWDDKAPESIVSENRTCLYVRSEDAGHLNWPTGRGVLVQRLEVDNVLETAEKRVEVHGNCELCATLVKEYREILEHRDWMERVEWSLQTEEEEAARKREAARKKEAADREEVAKL